MKWRIYIYIYMRRFDPEHSSLHKPILNHDPRTLNLNPQPASNLVRKAFQF